MTAQQIHTALCSRPADPYTAQKDPTDPADPYTAQKDTTDPAYPYSPMQPPGSRPEGLCTAP